MECESCNQSDCGSCSSQSPEQKAQAEQTKNLKNFLDGVKHKLVVMSGKGGVGKSTVAVNIALELSNQGFTVGLLDVDLHGPSVAGMLGLVGIPLNSIGNKIIPYQYSKNLKAVTVQGLLEEPDSALIWRGPLKIGVIKQFMSDVDWGPLDYLIIDCPPGTGDEPLTIAQEIKDAKAVVVTTPQKVSLADVRKSINFCKQVNMKVLGIVENMSGFVCPNCNTVHNIFKAGGGEKLAEEYALPLLGKLPLDPQIVDSEDDGAPLKNLSDHTKKALTDLTKNVIKYTD